MGDMFKKVRFIFFLLALLALLLIISDYVCGHTGDNPFIPNTCPICKIYQSTALAQLMLVPTLLFGIFPLIKIVKLSSWFLPIFFYLEIPCLRGPPLPH